MLMNSLFIMSQIVWGFGISLWGFVPASMVVSDPFSLFSLSFVAFFLLFGLISWSGQSRGVASPLSGWPGSQVAGL